MTRWSRLAIGIALLVIAGACSKTTTGRPLGSNSPKTISLPTFGAAADYQPVFDPSNFSANVDNPWFSLKPGSKRIYAGTKDGKPAREVFTPIAQTKVIDGVTCRVVVDKLYLNGKLAEDTLDYYTQDIAGNVWYFGEQTKTLEDGSTEGSWIAGVNGAKPGVYMEADPQVGHRFRQEYLKGHAEDVFNVVGLTDHVVVPKGSYDNALRTEERTALEPTVVDNKYYVRGLGQVLEVQVKGPPPIERLELVEVTNA
jgi:hypothetical protein